MPKPGQPERKPGRGPVKLACLACRVSRIRCDGDQPCHGVCEIYHGDSSAFRLVRQTNLQAFQCQMRNRECSYTPSRRGGSRKKRSVAVKPTGDEQPDFAFPSPPLTEIDHLTSPGAGLRLLSFDEINNLSNGDGNLGTRDAGADDVGQHAVRIYDSEHAILNAYYIYLHQYFPILPPPVQPVTPDNPIRTTGLEGCFPMTLSSPLCLAISAMLALIPFPDQAPTPVVASEEPPRRLVAHKLAQMALACAEADSELIDDNPGGDPSPIPFKGQPIPRFPVHPRTPVTLEAVLALLLLSNYEHTQRGNMLKMTTRASQALIMAKNMSLHRLNDYDDEFAEAKRRAWWMSYFRAQLCSVVRQSASIIMEDDTHFTTPYPTIQGDPEVWPLYVESLRVSFATVRLAAAREPPSAKPDPDLLRSKSEKIAALDAQAVQLIGHAKSGLRSKAPPIDGDPSSEQLVAKTMRSIAAIRSSSARIRLHRYHAFSDIPLFSMDHCDLSSPDFVPDTDNAIPRPNPLESSPFTFDEAAEVCVESALEVSRQLKKLPYPDKTLTTIPARMTPTILCCAMHASYVMMMQFYRLYLRHQQEVGGIMTTNFERRVDELRHSLQDIIAALDGFANVLEAIRGMKVDVEAVFTVAFCDMMS
ncbi:Fungal Zn binuclear cluster domain containing protein [Metarhizium album ARSEF 1941]|uniref:Fungal Zn binuclear cluster domain containing protein n=1 Tax=Metarhizium album (strain ARSEF 1941) TaxID=1081103 RepID=A0A0B2WXP3_METAS|nr:Fungal Zn binuclear cluster domain containing protein [Metarhizium album ARSEF 1941]KHN98344.1 Fungal Zn binuclear cluster domain containing protein [Metarhizium album ARSEF 1941]